jgi:hypothetical protein
MAAKFVTASLAANPVFIGVTTDKSLAFIGSASAREEGTGTDVSVEALSHDVGYGAGCLSP